MVNSDLDLINHPELSNECDQALREEYDKAREDYKDQMLPKVIHLIKQRCIIARREAIRSYCEKNGLDLHEVMAKRT